MIFICIKIVLYADHFGILLLYKLVQAVRLIIIFYFLNAIVFSQGWLSML